MNHFFKIILILIIINLNPKLVIGQSLEQLTNNAINQNLQLQILEKEYLAALEKAPQVSQLPDPEIGVGIFPLPVETRLGPQLFRLGATQMFPWKGVLDSKKELELSKARALYERMAIRQLNLVYEIKKSWLKLYEIQKSRTILEKNIQILKSLENLALVKIEAGQGSAADALRVQLKIKELEQRLEILEEKEKPPMIEINQILNQDLNTKINISDDLNFAELLFKKDTLLNNIQENHPLIRMFELQKEISEKALIVNELAQKPTFGVGADYIMVNKRDDAEPAKNGRDILQLRAMVKIPIYKQKYGAKEREEKLKMEALDIKKEDAVAQFLAIIEKAYAKHEMARLQKNLYEEQKEIIAAAIRILETDYSAKGNRFDELLQLEKDLIEFDLKILEAIVDSHLAKAEIEKFILK